MKAAFVLSLLAMLVGMVSALEFDLAAGPEALNERRCLSQWLPMGTHVKVKAKALPGFPGQAINMEIHDDSPHMNQYGARKHLDDVSLRFDTQAHANVIVCFHNILDPSYPHDGRSLTIQFKMDSGALANDYRKLQHEEKLKPMEVELRRTASILDDIQDELQYLKARESTLRDANEAMNAQVKRFTFFSIAVLISVAVYQVVYLRHFFQQKKLI